MPHEQRHVCRGRVGGPAGSVRGGVHARRRSSSHRSRRRPRSVAPSPPPEPRPGRGTLRPGRRSALPAVRQPGARRAALQPRSLLGTGAARAHRHRHAHGPGGAAGPANCRSTSRMPTRWTVRRWTGRPRRRAGAATTSSCRIGRELAKDARATLVVRYSGTPRTVPMPSGRGDFPEGVGLRAAAGGEAWTMQEPYGAFTWYPANDHPSDEAVYDVAVTVPKGWAGVAHGQLIRVETGEAGDTYHWRAVDPVASYLATLAAARYTRVDDTGPRRAADHVLGAHRQGRGHAARRAPVAGDAGLAGGPLRPVPVPDRRCRPGELDLGDGDAADGHARRRHRRRAAGLRPDRVVLRRPAARVRPPVVRRHRSRRRTGAACGSTRAGPCTSSGSGRWTMATAPTRTGSPGPASAIADRDRSPGPRAIPIPITSARTTCTSDRRSCSTRSAARSVTRRSSPSPATGCRRSATSRWIGPVSSRSSTGTPDVTSPP